MLKRKYVLVLAIGGAIAGLGGASAFGDNPSAPLTPSVTTTTSTDGAQGEDQQGQDGVDEQVAVEDIATAAVDVENEADNQGADDQGGDQGDSGDSGD